MRPCRSLCGRPTRNTRGRVACSRPVRSRCARAFLPIPAARSWSRWTCPCCSSARRETSASPLPRTSSNRQTAPPSRNLSETVRSRGRNRRSSAERSNLSALTASDSSSADIWQGLCSRHASQARIATGLAHIRAGRFSRASNTASRARHERAPSLDANPAGRPAEAARVHFGHLDSDPARRVL